ncbi:hypothetical protein [Hydrogenispora ethanolica]|nr:hypothetical protein [Hydrogenispora ethanolica]
MGGRSREKEKNETPAIRRKENGQIPESGEEQRNAFCGAGP